MEDRARESEDLWEEVADSSCGERPVHVPHLSPSIEYLSGQIGVANPGNPGPESERFSKVMQCCFTTLFQEP